MAGRGSRAWRKTRDTYRAYCQTRQLPCWLCHQPIDYQLPTGHPDAWSADHRLPVKTHPQLELDPENLRPAHWRCNQNRGERAPTELGATSRAW